MKTGDILYAHLPFVWYKPIRYISWAIRKVLKTPDYNHIAIYVSIWNQDYVAESTKGGVKITPLKKWVRDYKGIVKRPNVAFEEKEIGKRIMDFQGFTGYDYISLVFYQLYLQIFGEWIGKKGEKAKNKLYCSEYAALIYKEFFPKWFLTTPKDLYNWELQTEVFRGKFTDLL